jgi:hypothetical protein
MNKYTYLRVIQKNYGFGFEDVSAYEVNSDGYGKEYRNMKTDLKLYRENEGGNFRVIFRKEKNNAN